MTLTTSGTVQAYQLFLPFGSSRSSSGSMPTAYGFTDQRLDPSGLNYDHARYYDAGVGQFVSADSVQGPNRYAYVGGNPESRTDPTGNFFCPGPRFDGQCINIPSIVAGFVIGVGKTSTARQLARLPYTLERNRVAILRATSNIADAVEGSRRFNTWLRRGQEALSAMENNGEDLAKLADKAGFFKAAGRIATGVGAALDFGATAFDYYQQDSTDPTGLRIEKSAVAGAIHATIVTGAIVGVDALMDALVIGGSGGLATPLAVALDVGVDTIVGGLAGGAADYVVNNTPVVADVTSSINALASLIPHW